MPQTVSESGLFSNVVAQIPAPGLIPYGVNSVLWSDGTAKTRFIALSGQRQIEFSASGVWKFPPNAVVVKNFYIELEKGNLASRHIVETRFLVKCGPTDAWDGFSYMWDLEGEAAILLEEAAIQSYLIADPEAEDGFRNSGSRTDHGELSEDGAFAGARELPLSSAILRVPADGEDLLIPADEEALRASGYLYADGFRNAFDMAFAANGDLFAADNGPDSDMADEVCWVRQGLHYGFPWRMGAMDTAQRFPDYDPAADLLLLTRSDARDRGLFYNDPTYPPRPWTVLPIRSSI